MHPDLRPPPDTDLDAYAYGILGHRAGLAMTENPYRDQLMRWSWADGWTERALRTKGSPWKPRDA
jgi:hypothetical protein